MDWLKWIFLISEILIGKYFFRKLFFEIFLSDFLVKHNNNVKWNKNEIILPLHFSSILQINSLDMFFCFYMSFHITFSIALIVAMRNFSIFVYYFQITMKKYVDTNLWGLFQFEVKGRWITSFCKITSILKENIKVESHISWSKISRGLQSN